MKKFLSILCIIVIFMCGTSSVLAYNFPNALWQYHDGYNTAVANGDLNGIIHFGELALNVLANEPENNQTLEYFASRTYEIANAYEKLGQYEKAAEWFSKSIDSNTKLNYQDAVKIAKTKADIYTPQLNLYKQTDEPQVYFGAKNEHKQGVLWGVTSDSLTRGEFEKESMTMVYHSYGEEFNSYMETFLKDAVDKNIAIEFALNLKNEAADVLGVTQNPTWLYDFCNILNKYSSVPIYLRFAGEVNVWTNQPNPEDFKNAFRFVADTLHARCPHVAVVYGINFVSDWNSDFNKYYPGDEYVDWIGVSLYMNKYMQGQIAYTDEQKRNELMFYANSASEPVHIMKDIVDLYGDKKPIMIFESGASHLVRTVNETHYEWARNRLSELIHYLPMVYPQIKMQGYFNTIRESEHSDYALTSNDTLRWNYINMVNDAPHYIKDNHQNTGVSYADCKYGFSVDRQTHTFGVYSYAYNSSYKSVSYFIDGVQVAWSDTLPYRASIDFSAYPVGNHTMKIVSTSDTGVVKEKSVPFTVTEKAIDIIVNGVKLTGLDQPPVIVNGRTLVPVRAILTALGATVDWNGELRKVTTKKGDTVLELTIDSTTIYKNGVPFETDVPPAIINNRTLVPARVSGELFGMDVQWDGATRTVIINDK